MNAPRFFKLLTALVILVSLCSALLFLNNTKANAASTTTDKVSPELRTLIQSGQGSTRVNLIVQSTSSSPTSGGPLGGSLGGLVQTVGGVVKGLLTALNISLLEAPADSVDVLATDPDVSYNSLDMQ